MRLLLTSQLLAAVPAWVIGSFICLFGSTLTALGLVLQKLAHTKGRASKAQASYFTQKWWLAGFAVFLSAQVINMVSMAMTPQVLLSCLGSWTLVCNTTFAYLLLGERVSRKQALTVLGITGSMVLVLLTAPRPTVGQEKSNEDIQVLGSRFVRAEFIVLTSVLLFVTLLAGIFARRAPPPQSGSATASGCEEASPRVVSFRELPATSLTSSLWALVAAVVAGYTALLFKCVASLIAGLATAEAAKTDHKNALMFWQTYAIACAALTLAPMELHSLNMALRTGNAITVVPMYLSGSMLMQLTLGGIFFQEFQDFKALTSMLAFFGSVALTLHFVIAMAVVEASKDEPAEAEESAEPEKDPRVYSGLLAPALEEVSDQENGGEAGEDCLDGQIGVSMVGFAGAMETFALYRSAAAKPQQPNLRRRMTYAAGGSATSQSSLGWSLGGTLQPRSNSVI